MLMKRNLASLILVAALVATLSAQTPPAASAPAQPLWASPFWQLTPEQRQELGKLTEADHADMLKQLGITKLRPGKNGNTTPGTPNQANYDEAQANPYPN